MVDLPNPDTSIFASSFSSSSLPQLLQILVDEMQLNICYSWRGGES